MNSEFHKIRIVIADPQYLTSMAVESVLTEVYDSIVVLYTLPDLMHWLETETAGLLILDPALLDFSSLRSIADLKQKVPHIMILTHEISQDDFQVFNEMGIENIVLKSTDRGELLHAVELTLKGKKYYSEEILQLIIERSSHKNHTSDSHQLTLSEMEIVKLIAQGLTTKEIAARKFISFHTVMTHRKNIFRKTGVNSVSELIMYAIRAGWIDNIEYYI